jgi:hypothetical protein
MIDYQKVTEQTLLFCRKQHADVSKVTSIFVEQTLQNCRNKVAVLPKITYRFVETKTFRFVENRRSEIYRFVENQKLPYLSKKKDLLKKVFSYIGV